MRIILKQVLESNQLFWVMNPMYQPKYLLVQLKALYIGKNNLPILIVSLSILTLIL